MLISNYGLFWRRDRVQWGSPGVRGSLLGVCQGDMASGPVDFRDQQGVYVLYDDGFSPVYVGQAGVNDNYSIYRRLLDHARGRYGDRWTRFSWFGFCPVNDDCFLVEPNGSVDASTNNIANIMEAVLIESVEPLYNKKGGSFGGEVEYYVQHSE